MPKQTDSIELTNSLQGTVEYSASQEIIPEEKILQQGDFTYTTNGERTENPSEGYDGFDTVAVNVNVQPALQEKSVSYTDNGDNVVEADNEYYGLSRVNVTVDVPQGPVEAPENDVEFIDYDGTIVYSYTAEQFLALTEMPANPTHEGLTAQGWNWSLADAKEYVGDYGGLIIGQMYITDGGKTYIYISLPEGRTSPYLGICPNGTAHVEWGDGSEENVTGASISNHIFTRHNYANPGDYIIKITPPEGDTQTLAFSTQVNRCSILARTNAPSWQDTVCYTSCIKGVAIGKNVSIPEHGFASCYAMEFVIRTVSNSTFPFSYNLYSDCYLLKAFVCSDEKQSGVYGSGFAQSRTPNITRVSFFGNKNSSIALPYLSSSLFDRTKIRRITLPYKLRGNVGSMGYQCTQLRDVIFPSDTVIGSGTSVFASCNNLKKCILPNYTTLTQSFFSSCYSLTEIIIPDTFTTINASVFNNCVSLKTIKFKGSTPPSVANSNAFNNLPTDCIIYVPSGSLAAYTSATNYPSSSTYTYVEY